MNLIVIWRLTYNRVNKRLKSKFLYDVLEKQIFENFWGLLSHFRQPEGEVFFEKFNLVFSLFSFSLSKEFSNALNKSLSFVRSRYILKTVM